MYNIKNAWRYNQDAWRQRTATRQIKHFPKSLSREIFFQELRDTVLFIISNHPVRRFLYLIYGISHRYPQPAQLQHPDIHIIVAKGCDFLCGYS